MFHLFPALLMFLDLVLLSPPWTIKALPAFGLSSSIAVRYWMWVNYYYSYNGFYPYPIFELLDTPKRAMLFGGSAVTMAVMTLVLKWAYGLLNGIGDLEAAGKLPLNIQRLQDSEGNDLDLTYTVSNIFDDKSSNRDGSIVKIIHKDILREESVPPESGLRPGGSKKRSIQSLAPVAESEEGLDGGEEVEEIKVPVNLHPSKRQKLGAGRGSLEDEDEDEVQQEGVGGEDESVEEQQLGEEEEEELASLPTLPSSVAGSSTIRASTRNTSSGAASRYDGIRPAHHLLGGGPQGRGSPLIPETSQGIVELLSPKEETFSSPVFTATTYKKVVPNTQPVEISSPEAEELDTPVIAPYTVKGSGGKKAIVAQKQGTLKRPAKASSNKKSTSRGQSSVYGMEDSESEEEESEGPAPQKRRVNNDPPKKHLSAIPKRVTLRRSGASSSTPTLEVPSSQPEDNLASRILNDFVVEIPNIEDVRMSSRERELPSTPVPNAPDLISLKTRFSKTLSTGLKPSQERFVKPSLLAKN
ncbi:hypothetical protein TWF481_002907 [Arthrobotrys musiformis]|uniref:Uncharacterized protein n=1 Tax=Arthrobotrys musiformis TaxID=47236 RepID=A0AAV9VUI8_9PEZI